MARIKKDISETKENKLKKEKVEKKASVEKSVDNFVAVFKINGVESSVGGSNIEEIAQHFAQYKPTGLKTNVLLTITKGDKVKNHSIPLRRAKIILSNRLAFTRFVKYINF